MWSIVMCRRCKRPIVCSQVSRSRQRTWVYKREPVVLTDCSDTLAEILGDALPYGSDHRSLSGNVVGFLKVVAQELVLSGSAKFEIQAGWTRGAQSEMVDATLVWIPRRSTIGFGPLRYQPIPKDRGEEARSTRRLIRLDRSRILTFRLPKQWREPFSRVRREFPPLGRSQFSWMRESIGERRFPENFKEVRRHYNTQLARLCAGECDFDRVRAFGRGILTNTRALCARLSARERETSAFANVFARAESHSPRMWAR